MKSTAFDPYDVFYINHIKNTEQMNMKVQHYHDTYEIYLQISGQRRLFLDDISYVLNPDDLYILKPFKIHYTESLDVPYYERYVMNFFQEKLNFVLSEHEQALLFQKLDSCVMHLTPQQAALVLKHFKQADYYHKKDGFLSEKLLFSEVFQLVVILRDFIETKEDILPQTIPEEIVAAIHYLKTHYQEPIVLDDLAQDIHMSKYHFCRLFHRSTGATFLEYLYNIRLTKVHKMLLSTNLTLGEIATKTGFSSTAHLTRVFKATYGCSPRTFRKCIES